MFNRLKNLVLMQLSEKRGSRVIVSKSRKAVSYIIKVIVLVALILLVKTLIGTFQSIAFITINDKTILAILTVTQLLSIVTVTFGLMNTLYTSTDNVILLSLPTHHHEIFLSKLIVYYIYELKKDLYFLFPIFIGFGLHYGKLYSFDAVYVICTILAVITIPMFSVLIGAVLSIPMVFIMNFLKRHTYLNVLTVLGIITAACIGIALFIGQMPKNQIFSDIWNSVRMLYDQAVAGINKISLFYGSFTKIIFGSRYVFMPYLINFAILFGILSGLVILIIFISIPTYFKLATRSFETATKKKYKGEMKVEKNTFKVFFDKEVKLLFRSSDQMISTFIYLLILPFLIFTLNKIYGTFKLSEFGEIIIFGVNVLIGLILLLASNVSSATSITREGSEFYLMKIAPADTRMLAWAKVSLNLIISAVIAIVVAGCLAIMNILPPFDAFGIGIVFLFVNSGHILWSYELDLMHPEIHEYSMTHSVDNNKNATKSILLGTVLAFLFAAIGIWLLHDNYLTGWIRFIIIAIAFFIARLYLFINKTRIYFEDIQL